MPRWLATFVWCLWLSTTASAQPAAHDLDALLESHNPELRAQGLGFLNAEDSERISYLKAALTDAAPVVRLSAAKVLSKSPDPVQRREALEVLGDLVKGPEAEVRSESVVFLGGLGAEADVAVQRILVALHKGLLGSEGVDTLAKIGTVRAVSGIANIVSYSDEALKKSAVVALSQLGVKAQSEVEVLIRALEDPVIAELVLDALPKIGGARAFSGIMLPLRGTDKKLKLKALAVLRSMGSQAEAALPLLVRVSEDADPEIRVAAEGVRATIQKELLLEKR
ncbi:MAG: hypothetical protein GX589_03030 [Deltaproteobacteria bacterium]|nr:hypothetical protein [Deltaproteobacteria bacterium]